MVIKNIKKEIKFLEALKKLHKEKIKDLGEEIKELKRLSRKDNYY